MEILAAVALYGSLDRRNDSLATPLEEDSVQFAAETLGRQGWTRGKHVEGSQACGCAELMRPEGTWPTASSPVRVGLGRDISSSV